eukprot:TRINITY_DN531_c0_g2_i4.p1 TRINITY_DN531_c0_g2~~TRINITY_DN531_c0_g2_i4.p1  ORF type:complete len:364 (+),score=36.10 TRINITY_DN531_c0_g2_i4:129-1220(+)
MCIRDSFGTLPFSWDSVSSHFDHFDLTYLVLRPHMKCYQLVLDHVAGALVGPGRSFEAAEGRPVARGSSAGQVTATAGFGMHAFAWGSQTLHCLRQTAGEPVGTQCCAEQQEMVVLFAEGPGGEDMLVKMCCDLIDESEARHKNSFTIFHWNVNNGYWQRGHTVTARPLDSVVLPSATKDALLNDLQDFTHPDTEEYYTTHGIPYRRSYLFYGAPGSGKTSLIQALAGAYERNVCYIHPTHPKMTDDSLRAALDDSTTGGAIIVFEDIDAMFGKNRDNKVRNSPLTFSGLLNALDGIGDPRGQIIVLTTNFREQLDSALIRNGRVDMQVTLTLTLTIGQRSNQKRQGRHAGNPNPNPNPNPNH